MIEVSALAQFSQMNFAYKDLEFTKRSEGEILPTTSEDTVRRLNIGMPWEDWGGIRLSGCRCFFVRPNQKALLKSTVRRILGDIGSEIRSLVPILSCPNGQVKNFLNACRAVVSPQEQDRIAVIGSKASEGGGIWHQYFIQYLLLKRKNLIVDFYDYSERSDVRTYSWEGSTVSAEWISAGFQADNALEYQYVVDDVWTYEKGPGLLTDIYKGHYSKKGTYDQEGFLPFLHPTETRQFSEGPVSMVRAGCQCPVCRTIKDIVLTFEDYLFIRSLCARLGYVPPCLGVDYQGDMSNVGEMMRKLVSSPMVQIQRRNEVQQLIALSEEIGIELVGLRAVRAGEPRFKPFSRFELGKGDVKKEVFTHLSGRRVTFCGVSPDVLGSTEIIPPNATRPDRTDVVFVSKVEVWEQHLYADTVYSQITVKQASKHFPDFEATGRQVRDYNEYVRINVDQKKIEPSVPATILETVIKRPIALAHRVVSVDGGMKPPSEGFVLLSAKMSQGTVQFGPFQISQWRTSIYRNKDGSWGPVKKLIPLGKFPGDVFAKFPVPWDIAITELERIEADEELQKVRIGVSKSPTVKSMEWEKVGKVRKKKQNVHAIVWRGKPDIDIIHQQFIAKGYEQGLREWKMYLRQL